MPKTTETVKKAFLSQRLTRYLDINTDFGQTQDKAFFENKEQSLLSYVSSVNIPCCVHEGDPKEILAAINKAKSYNCAIGAHIAYPDPVHFGYEPMNISAEELAAWIHVQIGAFRALAKSVGADIEHVRPHGALYGQFLTNEQTALTVAETLYKIDPWMILVGPAGPILETVQQKTGIRIAPEIYLGKRYAPNGDILGDKFHESLPPQGAFDQAKQLITQSSLTTEDGQALKVKFNTIHISPRLEGAIALAEKINAALGQAVPLGVIVAGASGWL